MFIKASPPANHPDYAAAETTDPDYAAAETAAAMTGNHSDYASVRITYNYALYFNL